MTKKKAKTKTRPKSRRPLGRPRNDLLERLAQLGVIAVEMKSGRWR